MNTTPQKPNPLKVASNTPNPAVQPQRPVPQTAEQVAKAEAEKARQALAQAQADRIKAEAEAREREGKAIHRHGKWQGITIGLTAGIPLGVLIVFLAAMSLQDRFALERWSGAREAVSVEMRDSYSPPPAGLVRPEPVK